MELNTHVQGKQGPSIPNAVPGLSAVTWRRTYLTVAHPKPPREMDTTGQNTHALNTKNRGERKTATQSTTPHHLTFAEPMLFGTSGVTGATIKYTL